MAFTRMVQELMKPAHTVKTTHITLDKFKEWEELYMFDGLKSIRVGQSFCNHFDIVDYILYYMTNSERAKGHILSQYVNKK
jgi:hypothetical protein